MAELTKDQKDAQKRKILFVPCTTKAQLHKWIRIFLQLDIPDCIVDPDSNCSPMDMIFEAYSKMLRNDDRSFNRVLYYASRDSFKTLGASILELLVVLHLGRDVAHMAAIEAQSRKSQLYVKKFLSRPFLRDYLIGDSQEETWIARFNDPVTGDNLTEPQYKALANEDKDRYIEIRNYIKVVICTMQGANSDHVPFFVVDEVDVVTNPKAYEDAKMIPAPINGLMPLTLLTSTRKISTGLVQKEIDNAVDDEGVIRLHIRHWNLIDVTEACSPDRHLPDEPKIPIYVNEDELRAITPEKYGSLSVETQAKFTKEVGYAGCLKKCKLFAACKGRLATLQKSKSPLLRPIDHTINQFRTVSLPTALAQLLCRKPSTEGLIYPNFDRATHMLSPAQMAEMLIGMSFPASMTKSELVALMKTRDLLWYAGMDFGFTHNFVTVTGAVDGYRAFIIDVISQSELLPDEQIHALDNDVKHLNPSIFADPENPQGIAMFRKHGYRMRDWKKLPGSVSGGIDIVRMRLRPPLGEPLLFFLAGDAGCELLAKRLSKYHWKTDAAGRITDKPDDTDDDECDALRYFVMNVFAPKGKVKSAPEVADVTTGGRQDGTYSRENWMNEWLQANGVTSSETDAVKGRKGRFIFDI